VPGYLENGRWSGIALPIFRDRADLAAPLIEAMGEKNIFFF